MSQQPIVTHFFDEPTNTLSYVVKDPQLSLRDRRQRSESGLCLRHDQLRLGRRHHRLRSRACPRRSVASRDPRACGSPVCAPYLQQALGGKIAIGREITTVQRVFGGVFNVDEGFRRDGSQFDVLLREGDTISIGSLEGLRHAYPGSHPGLHDLRDSVTRCSSATRCSCRTSVPRAATSPAAMRPPCSAPYAGFSNSRDYRFMSAMTICPATAKLAFETTVAAERADRTSTYMTA
jgi:hypothetical protein